MILYVNICRNCEFMSIKAFCPIKQYLIKLFCAIWVFHCFLSFGGGANMYILSTPEHSSINSEKAWQSIGDAQLVMGCKIELLRTFAYTLKRDLFYHFYLLQLCFYFFLIITLALQNMNNSTTQLFFYKMIKM